jgi:uncharacterized membrane protein YphA (DoxX/SURF4 family)
MSISSTLDRLHSASRQNGWLWLFSLFCRVALAAGFIPAGIVKLIGERFASGLSPVHPMGHYLTALHTTGYYYTFIGIVQVVAAILLLIPRTATLGAFLFFPIILNICILTFAVRFDGSLFTAPLMTLANLYVIGWNYEKWKNILPFNQPQLASIEPSRPWTFRFPKLFFAGVIAAFVFFVAVVPRLYGVLPRNSFKDCQSQFKSNQTEATDRFCTCIHKDGHPLDSCLNDYYGVPKSDLPRIP